MQQQQKQQQKQRQWQTSACASAPSPACSGADSVRRDAAAGQSCWQLKWQQKRRQAQTLTRRCQIFAERPRRPADFSTSFVVPRPCPTAASPHRISEKRKDAQREYQRIHHLEELILRIANLNSREWIRNHIYFWMLRSRMVAHTRHTVHGSHFKNLSLHPQWKVVRRTSCSCVMICASSAATASVETAPPPCARAARASGSTPAAK